MSASSRRIVRCCALASVLSVAANCSSGDEFTASSVTSVATVSVATTTPASATTATDAATTTPATTTPAATTTTTVTTATTDPVAVLVPAVDPVGAVTHGTIPVDGRERSYRLYVPASLPMGPVPLFVGLHGGGGWGDQFASTNVIEGLAESNGFIVVHPDGIKMASGQGGVWNGGICCARAVRDGVDDVAFIDVLIAQLATEHDIDPKRTFAFGHSNGAIMSYRLACELSDQIVGIGAVAGVLGVQPCTPGRPVSVIQIHGTADLNIPIAGGVGQESTVGVDFPPPHAAATAVAAADGCAAPMTSVSGDISIELSNACDDRSAVEFVTIEGANHAWPGGTPVVTPSVGPGYAGYDATAAVVAFLLAHPRP